MVTAQSGDEVSGLITLEPLPAEAVGNIVKFLGMHPCERSDKVPDNKNMHTLLLAGKWHLSGEGPGCHWGTQGSRARGAERHKV